MTTAAIYLRQSLDATGQHLAVDRQREDCLRIAADRGWAVAETYVDNSISASKRTTRRPAYDRMAADFAAGRFDALVCWDLDRLTRQPRQLEDWIDAAEERGLRLVTANGEADLSTDGGRLFARIKASVARAEVERKAARQSRAAAQRAEHGRPPGGPRLTGYTVAGDVVAAEADMVRSMFDRFAGGDSLRSITAWLGDIGATTRTGREWNPSTVRSILTNPRFAGRAVYRGAPTGGAGAWLPLVDEPTFDRVQSILSDPRRVTNRVGTDRRHLGSGLYLCGVCGLPVTSFSGGRYSCRVAGHPIRAQGPIDSFVVDIVRGRLADPDLAEFLAPPDDQSRSAAAEIGRLRGRLAAVEQDYDAGLIDGRRFQVATAKIQAQIDAAQIARARAAVGVGPVLSAPDPVSAFDSAPLGVRRQVLAALVKVELHLAPRGRREFNPESVTVSWVDQAAV